MKLYQHRNVGTKLAVTLLGLSLAAGTVSFAADRPSNIATSETKSKLDAKDWKFLKEAAEDGMAEVRLGEMAKQQASQPQVKDLGTQMIADHTKANEELKSIAAKKGLTFPSDVDSKHKTKVERLSKLQGAEFDRAYVADLIKDHKTDIAEFEAIAKSAEDPDVKAFAEKTLPTLRSHLERVEAVQAEITKK